MLLPDDPILNVGDRVRIVCPGVPELCVDRRVGPDGTVDIPLVGAIVAATRLTSAIARDIDATGILHADIRYLGPGLDDVAVSGAVKRPLRLYAPRGIGRDRLLAAAQPNPEADLALLRLPARVHPGSLIEVTGTTADRRINVVGAVVAPSSLPPQEGLRLASALESAGGLTAHGDRDKIIVVRAGESFPLRLPADADFLLRPGDVVRVEQVAERRYVLVRGLVARPGSVEYAPGMTATRALADAGGLLPDATNGTLVWQTGSKTFRLSLAFLLDRRIPDPLLGPNDSLTIEATAP